MDWERFFVDSSIDECIDKFYSVLHTVIDSNVPNQRSTSITYPPWYTRELKNLISEKKWIDIKWKAVKAVRLQSNNFVFSDREELSLKINSKRLRSQCLSLSRKLYF